MNIIGLEILEEELLRNKNIQSELCGSMYDVALRLFGMANLVMTHDIESILKLH